ncbi:amino acid ABC transporter permease, partial [Klebsiella pneumoniae]|nr:amino acid ABC transporter permease [Klebsiella pneumoniae]
MTPRLDWHGALSGPPLQWFFSGFLHT